MTIYGKVVHGRGIGKSFGFPTANIETTSALPSAGVYSCVFKHNGIGYPAVINIGSCPTFSVDKETVEAHIIGIDIDIYGESVEIDINKKIRDIIKFNSPEELREQIKKDIEIYLGSGVI